MTLSEDFIESFRLRVESSENGLPWDSLSEDEQEAAEILMFRSRELSEDS